MMPFLFGLGYGMVRGAGKIASACGASDTTRNMITKRVTSLAAVLDIVGTTIAVGHEVADMAARQGSETGKKISDGINVAKQIDNIASRLDDQS